MVLNHRASLARVVAFFLWLAVAASLRAQEFRAAWADVFHVGMGSQTEVNNMVSALVSGNYNALIVQVLAYHDNTSSSHGAHWKSAIVPWSSRVTASFDPLAYLCQQAHANGIEVHAWLGGSSAAMYRISTAWPPAGNATLTAHPEWFIAPYTNSEANAVRALDSVYALDMGSPDVQEYIVSIVRELVTNYPIDGINWDDEINGTGYAQGFGYPAYSQTNYSRSGLARYRINTGVTGTPVNTDTAWANYRRRYKNELMARVQAEIQSIKTNPRQPLRHTSAALAYSPVPSSCNFVGSVPYTYFCDWAGMLQNGWVDAVIPQTYSQSTISNWINLEASCWQYNRNIFPGIGAYLTTDANIAGNINYTRSKGMLGNSIYSYAVANNSSPYNGDWWAYAAANVYTNIVGTPPMPWRNPATATEGIVWGQVKDYNTGLPVDDATVTVTGGPTVKSDGNGYYVATLVSATTNGTAHSTTASKIGNVSQTTNAIAFAGDIVRYDFLLIAPVSGVPAAPGGLTATAASSSQINLAWTDNATNETGQVVARSTVSGGPYTDIANLSSNVVAFTNTGLTASTTYFYVVRATNAVGASANSAQASATTQPGPATPPGITTPPTNRTIFAGESAHFVVVASGTQPLAYQWRLNGSNVSGATRSALTLSNVATNQTGGYAVVVTNSAGAITSSVATLTVNAPMSVGGMSVLWSLSPYSRPYLTTNSLPYERGMAHNPVTRRLLLVSRNGPHVYALDAGTGADLHELSVSGVSVGTYLLLMIGVADDGVVYAGNLTTAGTTTAFKLYRWANDEPATIPTTAYSSDPGTGNNQRWGDTLDVRGAGTNTQIIIGSRATNLVSVLTTTDGTNFASRTITVADAVPGGPFGLGIAFGAGNTFWGKATSQNLRQVSFDLAAGTGTTVRSFGNATVAFSVAPIGVHTALNVLGAINTGSFGNDFRIYDLTPATPPQIASTNFATDYDNTGSGTGAVDFNYDRAFALGANNGLLALQLLPVIAPPAITCPSNLAVQCYADIPSPNPAAVSSSSACGPVTNSFISDSALTNGCVVTVTRTYRASDACGHSSDCTQNITVHDTTPPSITCPSNLTVQSYADIPAPDTNRPSASDNCGGQVMVAFIGDSVATNGNTITVTRTYRATDACGNSAECSQTITAPTGIAPAITSHPQSQTAKVGTNVTFTVTATGTPAPVYQWRFNTTPIAGATDSSYTRSNLQTNDAGDYSVVVSNLAGTATSSNATLTVTLPIPIHIDSVVVLPDGHVQLQGSGDVGNYTIELSSNLVNWQDLTSILNTNGTFSYLDGETNVAQRFYRARRAP